MLEVMELGRRLAGPSLAERLTMTPSLRGIEWQHARNAWRFWGRPKQLVFCEPEPPAWFPGERFRWHIGLALGGRGMGKTRLGAETTWWRIESGLAKSVGLIAPSWKDIRQTMVGGLPSTDSGLLDVIPPHYKRGKDVVWKKNDQEIHIYPLGATVYLMTAEDKEQRGGNFDFIWGDEPIKWRYLDEVLDNLLLALRRPTGAPQMLLTTTPKPHDWLKRMILDPTTLVVHGTSHENASNLDPFFFDRLEQRFAGTRMGKQEVEAHILGDNERAIARSSDIESARVSEPPLLELVGVGVDPAVSRKRRSDDSGIVVVGRDVGGHLWVLEDASDQYAASDGQRGSSDVGWPEEIARQVKAHGARFVVLERNKIGDTGLALVVTALRDAGFDPVLEDDVRSWKRLTKRQVVVCEAYSFKDKWTRAFTTLSAPYEHGRIHHVGRFSDLESYLTQWDPESSRTSPGALDALVHVAAQLLDAAAQLAPPAPTMNGFTAANQGWDMDTSSVL